MQYEYYYGGLSPGERKIYRIIYDGIKSHNSIAVFDKVEGGSIEKIAKALEYDHPELYYWNNQLIQTKIKGRQMAIKLDYFWNKKEIDKNKPKLEKGIISILSKCKNQYDGDYERFLSIYACMARNISYDYAGIHSTEDNDAAYAHTILGVFARQKAVCDGISKAFKLVLERSGIDCIVISGKKPGEGNVSLHSWNIVWIDDKPCHVDLTWAIESSGKKNINYDYVGLTDAQIKKDHQIDMVLDVPKCNYEELDYYVRNNAVIKSSSELKQYLQMHAAKKPFEINVRLDYLCDIKAEAKKASDFIIKRYVMDGGFIKIDYQYREDQNILIIAGW